MIDALVKNGYNNLADISAILYRTVKVDISVKLRTLIMFITKDFLFKDKKSKYSL